MNDSKSAASLDGLLGHPHLAQHVDRPVERLRIGEPYRLAENAHFLEIADPPPDRGRGSADPFAQRGVTQAGVALQFANDSPVNGIELINFFHIFRCIAEECLQI